MLPVLTGMLLSVLAQGTAADDRFTLWEPGRPFPKTSEIALVEGIQFVVVKAREPEVDGYNWLHGTAIC